jgi:hypothetical protein
MKKEGWNRWGPALALLAAGLVLIGLALRTTHEVVKKRRGRRPHPRRTEIIPHHELTVDATDGGLKMERGHLWSTWDRTEPRVKRACPT